jgi:hypothetical protein
MRLFNSIACLALVVGAVSACASAVPPNRLLDYVGREAMSGPSVADLPAQRPVRTGLVLISDTSAPDAAPALPDEAVNRVAETLRDEINRITPFAIQQILPNDGIKPGGDQAQIVDFGKKQGVDYLAVVVLSSTEIEYPQTIFLGWTAHSQPGFRRDNWSLMEVALVDVKTGRTLIHAEGRGWATLDRPAAPGINQWYPVVWLRPSEPNWRWWPPTYEGAPNTLRVIAMNQAAKRLVLNLQGAWIDRLRMERPERG